MNLKELSKKIISCQQCPRLLEHCVSVSVKKRLSYQNETYWGKPVPGFGDPKAKLIIIGLAPGAHGANRTGRIFTGDRSGEWLYRALYKAGFSNQAHSLHLGDDLKLLNAYITCIVHCAPPENKPTPVEIKNCRNFLSEELKLLSHAKVYLALGRLAYQTFWKTQTSETAPAFKHGLEIALPHAKTLLLSYHPSQQNTFTGKLTEPMWDGIFLRARGLL